MIKNKEFKFSIIIFFLFLIIFLFHLDYIDKIGFVGDSNYYIEYSARIFEKEFEPFMFRPVYYLYGNLSQKLFGFNDYSIKLANLILFGFNGYLTFIISNKVMLNSHLKS